ETRRLLADLPLKWKPFSQALLVRYAGRFHRVADPRTALNELVQPLGTRRDIVRMLRLFQTLEEPADPATHDERLALDWLRWNGKFSPALIERLFRPLSGMLFLDRSLAVSSRVFRFALAQLAAGPIATPATGTQAIADAIAERIPPGSLRLGAKVDSIGHREVIVNGEAMRARAVIVTPRRLLDGIVPAVPGRGTALLHYLAMRPPIAEASIVLDGDGIGPVNHLAVLSNNSAEYAPPGMALIAAGTSCLPPEDDAELDRLARVQLSEWFGADVLQWRLLRIVRDEFAMPDHTAGTLDPWQRPVRIRPGLYVCGSVCDNSSMDGEATSGFRAAQAAMEDLVS
ncbi:MAG TPA: FAD-dependent oxidoreductase, partial [Urbifossiella sp.]|nr:FAD-dependent oxidoreductase [Urbifossiella sp.]